MNFIITIALSAGEAIVINELGKLVEYLKTKFVQQFMASLIDNIKIKVNDESDTVFDVKETGPNEFLTAAWTIANQLIGSTAEEADRNPELLDDLKDILEAIPRAIESASTNQKGKLSFKKLSFYYMQGLKIYQRAQKLINLMKREQGIEEAKGSSKTMEEINIHMRDLLAFIKTTKEILGNYTEHKGSLPYTPEVIEFIKSKLSDNDADEKIVTNPNWEKSPDAFYYFFKKSANWIGGLLDDYKDSPQEFKIATPTDEMPSSDEEAERLSGVITSLRSGMTETEGSSPAADELRTILLRKLLDFQERSSKNPDTGKVDLIRKDFMSFADDIPNEQIKKLFKGVDDWPSLFQAFRSVERVLKTVASQEPPKDAAAQAQAKQFLRGLYKQTTDLWSRYLETLGQKYPDKKIPKDDDGTQIKQVGKFSQAFAQYLRAQIIAQDKRKSPNYTSTYPNISKKLFPDKVAPLDTDPNQWESILQSHFSEKYATPIEAMIKKMGGNVKSSDRYDLDVEKVMDDYAGRKVILAEKGGKKYGFYKSTSRGGWLPVGGVVAYARGGQPFWMLKISDEEEGSDQTGKGIKSASTLGAIAGDLNDLDDVNEALLNEEQLSVSDTAKYLGKFFDKSPKQMTLDLEGAIKINRAFQKAGVLKKDWAKSHKVMFGREDEKSFWGIDDIDLAGMMFMGKGKIPEDFPTINKDGIFTERPLALLSREQIIKRMKKLHSQFIQMKEVANNVIPAERAAFKGKMKKIIEKYKNYKEELTRREQKQKPQNESQEQDTEKLAKLLKSVVADHLRTKHG